MQRGNYDIQVLKTICNKLGTIEEMYIDKSLIYHYYTYRGLHIVHGNDNNVQG